MPGSNRARKLVQAARAKQSTRPPKQPAAPVHSGGHRTHRVSEQHVAHKRVCPTAAPRAACTAGAAGKQRLDVAVAATRRIGVVNKGKGRAQARVTELDLEPLGPYHLKIEDGSGLYKPIIGIWPPDADGNPT